MYYADLTPYDYGIPNYQNMVNIGWLDAEYEFPTGDFPEKEYVVNILEAQTIKNRYRGFHGCQFCDSVYEETHDETGKHTMIIRDRHGNGEYHVMGEDVVYSAPVLVTHYISVHNYKPPQEFIDAVLNSRP